MNWSPFFFSPYSTEATLLNVWFPLTFIVTRTLEAGETHRNTRLPYIDGVVECSAKILSASSQGTLTGTLWRWLHSPGFLESEPKV